jgi:hypothetical protein
MLTASFSERTPISGRALEGSLEGTVTKSSQLTLRQLGVELHDLQDELGVQTKRIAQMQAELDLLPTARRRRELLRGLLTEDASPTGNWRRHE